MIRLMKRAPVLPPTMDTDEIIDRIDEELNVLRGLTKILADRAREVENSAKQK